MSLFGFGKTAAGADAVDIAGHPVPVSALAIVGTVAAGWLVLRNRGSSAQPTPAGSAVAAATTPPAYYDPLAVANSNVSSSSAGYSPTALDWSSVESQLSQLEAAYAGSLSTPGMSSTPPPAPTPTSEVATVYNDYVTALGRAPQPNELAAWVSGLHGGPNAYLVPGASGSDTLDQVNAWIAASPEASAHYAATHSPTPATGAK